MVKIARKYMEFQSVEGIGKKAHALTDLIFTSYSQCIFSLPFYYQLQYVVVVSMK
jgi:hypothetical protein